MCCNPIDPSCFLDMFTSVELCTFALKAFHNWNMVATCWMKSWLSDCRSDTHASDGSNCLTGRLPLRLCCPFGLLLGIDLTLVRADIASLKLCSSLQSGKHALG